ncbi:MAG: ATP-dependent RecD-like DNA helicase [Planctomycetes bacterium]|nr:ATP-dependent RecD-like DNA helicase [Planctomycetota bacterium]
MAGWGRCRRGGDRPSARVGGVARPTGVSWRHARARAKGRSTIPQAIGLAIPHCPLPMSRPNPERDVERVGTIERFTFRNPDTGWAVVKLCSESDGGTFVAVGEMAQLAEGQRLRVFGKETSHPRFGLQVHVSAFEPLAPSTTEGIEAYLASGLVKGIGPATAKNIVAAFGADTLRVIEHEPDRLEQVRRLGPQKRQELRDAVLAQKDLQNVLVFLRAHGLGAGLASRIVKRYGAKASALIQANPYRLADEVLGIGFRTADRLAGQMGMAPDADERLDAGLEFCLRQASKEGHTFLPEDVLLQRGSELLGCRAEELTERIRSLAAAGRVVRQLPPGPALLHDHPTPIVYPRQLAVAEDGIARALHQLVVGNQAKLPIQAEAAVSWFEQTSGMQLPTGQKEALRRALAEPVSVITGGPGVGKTTIVQALARILARKQLRLLLAAPTGRAARRLEEAAGHAASTLHRLLEFTPGMGRFQRDAERPLEGDMLVVDEASMLDVPLAYSLLRAVPPGMHLVLVGDRNQLPSVGPGNVLADILASGLVASTALTRIFRQQQGSKIVQVAHGLLQGTVPDATNDDGDFYFVEAESSAQTHAIVLELVTRRIPQRFALDALRDVQVLCPMYRGEAGADALNRDLQDAMNPGQIVVERAGRRFRVGDKVMQARNDYDREVWNGDVGRIVHIDKGAATALVRFPDREHRYRFEELADLLPAYAISVHRSQGSEYPAVVVPVVTDHFLMLRRSVLYTAITRARKLVVLVGSRKALEMAVRNTGESHRHSALAQRLQDLLRADHTATSRRHDLP